MARDLAIVSGFTGRMASVPSAKAVATGEQPCGLGSRDTDRRLLVEDPDLPELLESLGHLGQLAPRTDGHDDMVRGLPSQLLGHLEGQGLRALGVVGADIDIDERP